MVNVTLHKPEDNQPNEETAVTLSEKALAHVKKKIAERGSGCGVHLSVKKAGCSGLQYVVDFVDEHRPDDYAFKADDEIIIYVDKKSFAFLKGTHIDYIRDGLNAHFKFTNPNESGACGCGESFFIEEE